MAKRRTSKRRSSKRKRAYAPPKIKRYWVWLYYNPSVDPGPILKPWGRWGDVTGSGAGMGEADISWEMSSLPLARRRAKSLHSLMSRAKVGNRTQIVDTGSDGGDHKTVATYGNWHGRSVRSRRKR